MAELKKARPLENAGAGRLRKQKLPSILGQGYMTRIGKFPPVMRDLGKRLKRHKMTQSQIDDYLECLADLPADTLQTVEPAFCLPPDFGTVTPELYDLLRGGIARVNKSRHQTSVLDEADEDVNYKILDTGGVITLDGFDSRAAAGHMSIMRTANIPGPIWITSASIVAAGYTDVGGRMALELPGIGAVYEGPSIGPFVATSTPIEITIDQLVREGGLAIFWANATCDSQCEITAGASISYRDVERES